MALTGAILGKLVNESRLNFMLLSERTLVIGGTVQKAAVCNGLVKGTVRDRPRKRGKKKATLVGGDGCTSGRPFHSYFRGSMHTEPAARSF